MQRGKIDARQTMQGAKRAAMGAMRFAWAWAAGFQGWKGSSSANRQQVAAASPQGRYTPLLLKLLIRTRQRAGEPPAGPMATPGLPHYCWRGGRKGRSSLRLAHTSSQLGGLSFTRPRQAAAPQLQGSCSSPQKR